MKNQSLWQTKKKCTTLKNTLRKLLNNRSEETKIKNQTGKLNM